MIKRYSAEEKIAATENHWSRLSPIIIYDYQAKDEPFQKAKQHFKDIVEITEIVNPLSLYRILLENQSASIIFSTDVLCRRKNYIDILQGAVCSSPDSMALWTVNYEGQKGFIFKGRILMLTNLSLEEINKKENLKYIVRDCLKI